MGLTESLAQNTNVGIKERALVQSLHLRFLNFSWPREPAEKAENEQGIHNEEEENQQESRTGKLSQISGASVSLYCSESLRERNSMKQNPLPNDLKNN